MQKRSLWVLGSVLLAMLLVLGVSCSKKEVRVQEEPMEQPVVQEEVVVEETVVVEEPDQTAREDAARMAEAPSSTGLSG